MAELIIRAGKLQGKRILLPEREVVIGRDPKCHLRLTSSLVSHEHCALSISAEGIQVRDLGSQNGTFVNDVEVKEPQWLQPGDILRVGASLFEVPESAPAASRSKKSTVLEISDADIANWLTDEGSPTGPKESDTTVIPKKIDSPTDTIPTRATSPETPVPRPTSDRKSAYRSVKDEAAEIIRKHWEVVRSKKGK